MMRGGPQSHFRYSSYLLVQWSSQPISASRSTAGGCVSRKYSNSSDSNCSASLSDRSPPYFAKSAPRAMLLRRRTTVASDFLPAWPPSETVRVNIACPSDSSSSSAREGETSSEQHLEATMRSRSTPNSRGPLAPRAFSGIGSDISRSLTSCRLCPSSGGGATGSSKCALGAGVTASSSPGAFSSGEAGIFSWAACGATTSSQR
mmetsp:Transcript_40833/g.82286  ORF Transcript_40833/g.82286 Transcript_40833/m.82286 type:complete len:204 (-) Transcript_40833:102-713(-)